MSVLSYQMMIENRLGKWIEKELEMGDWLGASYHIILLTRIITDEKYKKSYQALAKYYKNIALCYC